MEIESFCFTLDSLIEDLTFVGATPEFKLNVLPMQISRPYRSPYAYQSLSTVKSFGFPNQIPSIALSLEWQR
jgi:hypothetical protein